MDGDLERHSDREDREFEKDASEAWTMFVEDVQDMYPEIAEQQIKAASDLLCARSERVGLTTLLAILKPK